MTCRKTAVPCARDREDRFRHADLGRDEKMAARTGFLRRGTITCLSLPLQCGDGLRQASASVAAQPIARMAGWRQENWAQQDSAGRHGT